jgi:hypothetical protein
MGSAPTSEFRFSTANEQVAYFAELRFSTADDQDPFP